MKVEEMVQYNNPRTLQEAYALLASGKWKILSGGTDFYPSLGTEQVDCDVLDISRISSIRSIQKDTEGNWHIGALTTWSDVINHDLPPSFDSLKLSAKEVGSIQIQNRATVVGNICNASPAADGVPPLLTLCTLVNIGSADGVRTVPLDQFILGNRHTALQPGEMVIGLTIPADCANGRSTFLKLGARKYLVISISMVAARLAVGDDDTIEDAAVAVGSCSVVATRLNDLEKMLVGQSVSANLTSLIDDRYFRVLSPIDDVRATGDYRIDASKELVKRALDATAREY